MAAGRDLPGQFHGRYRTLSEAGQFNHGSPRPHVQSGGVLVKVTEHVDFGSSACQPEKACTEGLRFRAQ
eukprot:6626699-Karenia_brevis.AAC.1